MKTSDPLLSKLLPVAREAGRIIMLYYRKNHSVRFKSDKSPLTLADVESNRLILKALKSLTPGVPIISEETRVPAYAERKAWRAFWLVDPLDGTKEFLKGLDEFTVNIALIRDGNPVLGIVFAPALNLLYYASEARGSYKITRGGPRKIYRSLRGYRQIRVVTSRSHGTEETGRWLEKLGPHRIVRVGSSLKFCYVADGKADIYPRLSPCMEWDVAAGDCVYRYATRGKANPSPLRYNKRNLLNGPFVVGREK